MKKFTKKQVIIGTSIAILLIGGGTTVGVINHNNTVHAQQVAHEKAQEAKAKADKKAKALKLAQEKEDSQQKQVVSLLSNATANPSDASIKAVNAAIAKLTTEKNKTQDTNQVKTLNARLTLIKKAQAAVKDYQAHATDATKQKAAQAAINALKDKNDSDVKAQLQKLYDASNQQAQAAAKSAQAKQATSNVASASANDSSQAAQTTQNQAVAPSGNTGTGANGSASADSSQGWVAANSGNTSSASYTGGGASTSGGTSSDSAPAQQTQQTQQTPSAPAQATTPQTPSSSSGDQLDNWNSPKNQAIIDQDERDGANAPAEDWMGYGNK